MSDVGRNDPCPCGSGQKYKKCCLPREAAASAPAPELARARELMAIDQKLFLRLFTDMMKKGEEEVQKVLKRLDLESSAPEESVTGLVFSWMLYHYPIAGRTPAQACDAERLPESQRKWLHAQQQTPLSLWQAVEVHPGKGILAEDVLLGGRRFIWDTGLARSCPPRAGVLGLFVTQEDFTVTSAVYPMLLPEEAFAKLLETLRARKSYTLDSLLGPADGEYLIGQWMKAVAAFLKKDPPFLTNAAGESLRYNLDRYTFPAHRQEEVERALPGVKVEPGTFSLETTSLKQTKRERERIEKACAGLEVTRVQG